MPSIRPITLLSAVASALAWVGPNDGPCATLYLRQAYATLTVTETAVTPEYDTYFHVPISFQEQIPRFIDVQSSAMIDYRFLPLIGGPRDAHSPARDGWSRRPFSQTAFGKSRRNSLDKAVTN